MNQKKSLLLGSLTILTLSALIAGETFFSLSSLVKTSIGYKLIDQVEPNFDTLVNFRDLGNYRTKDGKRIAPNKLLRSAHMHNLSANDIDILENSYNVNHIVDFRTGQETIDEPDATLENAKYRNIDVTLGDASESPIIHHIAKNRKTMQGEELLTLAYEHLVTSSVAQQGFSDFIQILVDNEDGAVIWHCWAGKDRTGLAAALVLYILGVDKETIYADYMETNTLRAAANEVYYNELRAKGASEQEIEFTKVTVTVEEKYLDHAIAQIKEKYESIDNYIENVLGISQEQQEILRAKYLLD